MKPGHPSGAGRVGLLSLVPDRWGASWQSRHHVLSRLCRHFPVVWLEPHLSWRELRAEMRESTAGSPAPAPDRLLVRPSAAWLPHFYRPAGLGGLTRRCRLGLARRTLLREGCDRIVVYLWRPAFAPALDAVTHDLSCYHIDDEYSFREVETPLDDAERRLIERVDQVFVTSPSLLRKKGSLNPATELVPNGVDYAAYSSPRPVPSDLESVPRPRIGYSGHVKRQLDWELLAELVARHPDWQFVFVGQQAVDPETAYAIARLGGRPNVHLLGAKTVWQLASYPQHFDVCIMPYRRDGYTRYIYPLKLHEYLASGTPVVGTRLPSLEPFSETVLLADGVEQWNAAIGEAMQPERRDPEHRRSRQDLARRHDWDLLVARIAAVISRRLGLELDAGTAGS